MDRSNCNQMKTILITGSTDGIGKGLAIKLAEEGQQVIIHGRNQEKLRATLDEIQSVTKNDKIQGIVADLSNFNEVNHLIESISSQYDTIDVLINNAGVFTIPTEQRKGNFDIRFLVNYFAPVILTQGLLPLLKNSDKPRVINLSSAAQSSVSMLALVGQEELSTQEAYAQSKLALTMWSFYLAKTYAFMNVMAVNPGSLLNTKMVQEAYGRHWSSADKGISILYSLAMSPEYDQGSGKYFDNDHGGFNEAHSDAYDPIKIDQLIKTTQQILEQL